MNLCSIGDFSSLVRDRGGEHVVLSGKQPTSSLPPLEVVLGTDGLVLDPDDVQYLSREAADAVRVSPQVLFACPAVDLYGAGVAALGTQVCKRTLRTKKFMRLATEHFEKAGGHMKSVAYSRDDHEPALLLAPIEQYNYSHWILEAVPKLGLFQRAYGRMPNTALMVGSASAFHADSIAYVSASTALKRVKSVPVNARNICWTTSLARSVSDLHPEVFRFYDAVLREKFGARAPDRRRLYVSRANAQHRRVENEPELVEALAGLGFTVVDPGAHGFEAQVAMFWNAEVVVGAHGAGLTNLAFAANCRLAFELLSSGFRDSSTYAHICRHRRIAYGAASGEPVPKETAGPRDPEGWPGHRSFRIDVKRVVQELRDLL